MLFRYAKRLANRDEVTLKETGEVGYVLGEPVVHPAVIRRGQKRVPPYVEIPAQFPSAGFTHVTHLEVD